MYIGIYQGKNARGSVILSQIIHGLQDLGVRYGLFNPNENYDYVLVFNTTAHIRGYNYENIKYVDKYKFAFIDCAEYGWQYHYKEYDAQSYNAFAPIPVKAKVPEQSQLLSFLKDKSYPYFLREMREGVYYPDAYHPIDYPLHRFNYPTIPEPNRDEYKKRPLDLFVSWGNSHPFRHELVKILRNLPLKSEIRICDKIHQLDYFRKIASARMSISFDGYGYGSFREKEILSRTLAFINKKNLIEYDPLRNGGDFVQYTTFYKLDELGAPVLTKTDVGELMMRYAQDWDHCYDIYESGFRHCLMRYSEKATAEYILTILENHDWSKKTEWKLC